MGESPATVLENPLQSQARGGIIPKDRNTVLMMGVRKLLIDGLTLVEDYLGLPHSIPSADERREFRRWQQRQAGG